MGFGGQHGYLTDPETGLQLLTHRYYDAGRGRFLTRDPIGYGGGVNLYGFAGNNPVNRQDPSGFDPDGHSAGDWIDNHLLGGAIDHWGDTQGLYDGGYATLSQRNWAAVRGSAEVVGLASSALGGGVLVRSGVKMAARGLITRGLRGHMDRAIPLARDNFTPQQVLAVARDASKEDTFLGSHIDKIAKNSVARDWLLKRLVKITKTGYGPDFYSPTLRTWWDMTTTTKGQWEKQVLKYGVRYGHGISLFWK